MSRPTTPTTEFFSNFEGFLKKFKITSENDKDQEILTLANLDSGRIRKFIVKKVDERSLFGRRNSQKSSKDENENKSKKPPSRKNSLKKDKNQGNYAGNNKRRFSTSSLSSLKSNWSFGSSKSQSSIHSGSSNKKRYKLGCVKSFDSESGSETEDAFVSPVSGMTVSDQVEEINNRGFENEGLVSDDLENEDPGVRKNDIMEGKKEEREEEDLSDLGSVTSLESSPSGSPRFHLKMSPVPRRNRKKHSADPSHSPVSFRSGYQSNRSSISSVRKGILKKTNSCTTINMEMANLSRPDSPTENGSSESIDDIHANGNPTRFARTKDNPHLHHQRSFNRVKFILDSGRPDNITGDYDDIKIEKNNDRCDKLKSNEKEEDVGLSHSGRKCLGFSAGILLLTMAVILGSFFGSRKSALSPKALANSGSNIYKTIDSALEGKFKILNQNFIPALYDSKSPEFRKMSLSIEDVMIKAIFVDESVNQRNSSIKLRVVKYEKGSIMAVFRIMWEGLATMKLAELRKRILKHLGKYGAFGEYKIDRTSFTISELRDLCVGNSQSCSHICYLNDDTLRFDCTCPDSLILINNTHCISPKLTTTTARNQVVIPNIINKVLKVSNAELFAVNQETVSKDERQSNSAEKKSSKSETLKKTTKASPKNVTQIPQESTPNITTTATTKATVTPSKTTDILVTSEAPEILVNVTTSKIPKNSSIGVQKASGLKESKGKNNSTIKGQTSLNITKSHDHVDKPENSSVVNDSSTQKQENDDVQSITVKSTKIPTSSSEIPSVSVGDKITAGNNGSSIHQTTDESSAIESNVLTKNKVEQTTKNATKTVPEGDKIISNVPHDNELDTSSLKTSETELKDNQVLLPVATSEDVNKSINVTTQISSFSDDDSDNKDLQKVNELTSTAASTSSNDHAPETNNEKAGNISAIAVDLSKSDETSLHSNKLHNLLNLTKVATPVANEVNEFFELRNNTDSEQSASSSSETKAVGEILTKLNHTDTSHVNKNDSIKITEVFTNDKTHNQSNTKGDVKKTTSELPILITNIISSTTEKTQNSVSLSTETSSENISPLKFNKSSIPTDSINAETSSIQFTKSDEQIIVAATIDDGENKAYNSSVNASRPNKENLDPSATGVDATSVHFQNISKLVTTVQTILETKINVTNQNPTVATTIKPNKTLLYPLKEIVTIKGTPLSTVPEIDTSRNVTEGPETKKESEYSTNSPIDETVLQKIPESSNKNTDELNPSIVDEHANNSPSENNDSLLENSHNATSDGVNSSSSHTSKPLPTILCQEDEFQCGDGECISKLSRCDSVFDCKDQSDEVNCIENKCMENYQCHWSGNCLSRRFVCDGIKHCSNGEDEMGCETWKCTDEEFQCTDGSAQTCIPKSHKCDSHGDCLNRTDEIGCATECPNDQFLCPEGSCIPNLWKCDGTPDCLGGADELECDCEGLDQFLCTVGGCVPKFKVCDGLRQCPDGSDEWGCLKIDNKTKQLHVKSNGKLWSTVCGDKWTSKWTDLVCQQLGFGLSLSTEVRRISDSILMPRVALSPDVPEVSRVGTTPLQYFLNPGECPSDPLVHLSCNIHECGRWNVTKSETGNQNSESELMVPSLWPSLGLLVQVGSWGEKTDIFKTSCAATVITPTWVLVSYSCLVSKTNGLNAEKWALLIGDFTPKAGNENTQLRYAKQVVVYPGAKRRRNIWEGDAALVRLQVALNIEVSKVSPICLTEKPVQTYDSCVIGSWKIEYQTGENAGSSSVRRQIVQNLPVPNLTKNTCNESYFGGRLTMGHLCASFVQEKGSPCEGQEGSPLMCRREDGPWQLQGLLSHTGNCAASLKLPSIFTDVSSIHSWLQSTVGRHYQATSDQKLFSSKAKKNVASISAFKNSSTVNVNLVSSSKNTNPSNLIPSPSPLIQNIDSANGGSLSNVPLNKQNDSSVAVSKLTETNIESNTHSKELIEKNSDIS